jgi:hypothetical protein
MRRFGFSYGAREWFPEDVMMMHMFERGPVGEAVSKTIAEVLGTDEFKKKLDDEIKAALDKELPVIVNKMVTDRLKDTIERSLYGGQGPIRDKAEEYIKEYLASAMGTDIRTKMDALAADALSNNEVVKRVVRETFSKELYALASDSVDKAMRNRAAKDEKAKKKR